MDLCLATLKAVSFYLLHNGSALNQCRKFSCGTVVCKHFASYQGYPNYRWDLTLSLLMSYIYGVPCKARNFNVVYIWTYVWQRWKPPLSICCTMFQHWINAESYTCVTVVCKRFASYQGYPNYSWDLTLSLLMSYIHGALCKARNFDVVYIYGATYGNAESRLFLFAAQYFNTESMQKVIPVSQLCVNALLATNVTLITDGI
jgi:hypothetical protein